MESLNQKPKQLFCAVRRQWITAQPEELVRQRLILLMTKKLNFPPNLLVVEMSLTQMPHFRPGAVRIPERRADIVCFAKNIHPRHTLYPLILIECKAVKLSPKVVSQVTGYNHFVGAYFIAIANQEEIKLGCYDAKNSGYAFVDGLPSFDQLVKLASVNSI